MSGTGIPALESDEDTEATERTSQETLCDDAMDAHLWASFIPFNRHYRRLDFSKLLPTLKIGRHRSNNHFVFDGMKISNFHCEISWNGIVGPDSAITVSDFSLNGTFINGVPIGRGRHALLHEGNEIAFGSCTPGPDDCRFLCRHLASGPRPKGLHKDYDLGVEIGKGTYATVMKALHRSEQRWYAIKIIHPNKREVSSFIGKKMYEREVEILEKLQHPNICQLKDYFWEENNFSLVLELVEGGDLLEYMIKHGKLREHEVQHITYQICNALSYVHALGVAHRDLKPENILLTKDKPPVIKIADFGLANVIDDESMMRSICGTPWYIAPEMMQQEGNEGYNQLVDSWSTGVTLFSLLTHDNPFAVPSGKVNVKDWVNERRVNWDILLRSGVSKHGENFVRRLLEFEPRKRMTLVDALAHPWLVEHGSPSSGKESESVGLT